MNLPREGDTPPGSHARRTFWPSLIWSVPLAAVLIVVYLGIQALSHRGEIVTVTFRHAADAKPGDTKVIYEGVEAGQLVKITPNKDGRRLDFQLRLVPEAKSGLNSNARFWLIGASPTLSDLSSLKAVVSGVAIGYAPGEGGTPTTSFEGLDRAPVVLPGDKGTHYWLTASTLGSINEGSSLLFHGQTIGKITEVQFHGQEGFKLGAFVFHPYDSLIKPGARFWRISPVRFSLSAGGINANMAPVSTLLGGGIDLELETAEPGAVQSPPESEFLLFESHTAAREGLTGPTVEYEFTFDTPSGDLDEESAVTLLGFPIGRIEQVRLSYQPKSGRPFAIATAAIFPARLGLDSGGGVSADELRSRTDDRMRQLLALGFRARLEQTPPLIGNRSVALVKVADARRADLLAGETQPRIPSASGAGGVDELAAKADELLTKLDRIPFERIGADLQQVTAGLGKLVTSPEMSTGIEHLSNTLAEIDRMLQQVEPQLGPLMGKLNEAAGEISQAAGAAHRMLDTGNDSGNIARTLDELNEAARSIKTLTDYLNRHPEALIRGKRPE